MNLVSNYKHGLKFWSVQLGILAGICETLNQLVPLWGQHVPWWVSSALITASVLSRFIKQNIDNAEQI